MSDIEATLLERGNRYGEFDENARLSQRMKAMMRLADGWLELNMSQREALEMIVHKIARIINGDSNYDDSWRDIAGYAQLVVDQLRNQDGH